MDDAPDSGPTFRADATVRARSPTPPTAAPTTRPAAARRARRGPVPGDTAPRRAPRYLNGQRAARFRAAPTGTAPMRATLFAFAIVVLSLHLHARHADVAEAEGVRTGPRIAMVSGTPVFIR